jgi:DNA-binding protein H-NS
MSYAYEHETPATNGSDVPATNQADELLRRMTPAELRRHIEAAQAQLQASQEQAKETLRAKLEELVADAGLSMDEALAVIRPTPTPTPQRRKARSDKGSPRAKAVKYRHPDDPTKTWSGKGRMPGWMKGANPEDFLATPQQ